MTHSSPDHDSNHGEGNSLGQPAPSPSALLRSSADGLELAQASDQLVRLQQQIHRLQRALRLAIEGELAQLSGRSFGTLAANQSVVAMIHEMLETHGVRVRCPECGHPAILRCSSRPGLSHGAFVLDHTIDGRRTFHGGYSTVPVLRLLAKPPRRSSKKAS